MNFLTYPPTAWQFDGEYDSFTVVCERETDREKQRQRKRIKERKEKREGGTREGEGGGGEVGRRGERERGRECESVHQLAKKLIFSHFYRMYHL